MKTLLLTGFFVGLCSLSRAQTGPTAIQKHISAAEDYFYKQQYQAASASYRLALRASNANHSFDTSAAICLDMATVAFVGDDVRKALEFTRQALTYFDQADQCSLNMKFRIELSFATYYKETVSIDSATVHFRQCNQLIRLYPTLKMDNVQVFLRNYADFQYSTLAYHEAIRLNQQALFSAYTDDTFAKATAYNNLGRCYREINQFTLADSAFRQAFVRYNDNLSYQAIVLNNLADSQLKQGHLTDAAATLQTARQLYRRYSQQPGAQRDFFTEQRLSVNTAELLFRQGRWSEAEAESHRLTALCRAYFPMPTPALVENYLRLSALHQRAGRWSEALTATQQAIAEAQGTGKVDDRATLPRSLLTALTAQGRLLRRMPAADTATRIARDEQAFAAYQQAIRLATSVRRGVVFTNSKTFLARYTADLFDPALELAHSLSQRSARPAYYRDRAFYLLELSRNTLLTDAQTDGRVARAYLPAAIRTELQQQQQALSQLALLRETARDNTAAGRISAQVARHENQLLAVQQRIERNYPAYTQAKRQLTDWSLPALQQRLGTGEVLISYSPLPSGLLILACSRTQSTLRRVAVPLPVLLFAADRFRAEVSRDPGRVGLYDPNPGRRLYDYLLRPLEADLLRHATALTLLPPPDLLLPFDALSPRPGAFLIQDYDVGYQYNLTRFYAPDLKPDAAPANPLVLAPFTGDTRPDSVPGRSHWRSLPASRREIDFFGGTALRDGQATKRAFLQQAPATNLIVCATHTVSGPAETGLVFWPGETDHVLYPSQVQHLDLRRAELVMLSACATEQGVPLPGDGVQSLGRSFAWAGAGAVTCSLFPLDDAAQGRLAESFYRNLSPRQSIRQTLRDAKIAYLNSDEGQQTGGHPFFGRAWSCTAGRTPRRLVPESGGQQWSGRCPCCWELGGRAGGLCAENALPEQVRPQRSPVEPAGGVMSRCRVGVPVEIMGGLCRAAGFEVGYAQVPPGGFVEVLADGGVGGCLVLSDGLRVLPGIECPVTGRELRNGLLFGGTQGLGFSRSGIAVNGGRGRQGSKHQRTLSQVNARQHDQHGRDTGQHRPQTARPPTGGTHRHALFGIEVADNGAGQFAQGRFVNQLFRLAHGLNHAPEFSIAFHTGFDGPAPGRVG